MTTFVRAFAVSAEFEPEKTRDTVKKEHPSSLVQTFRIGAASNERFLEVIAAQTIQASSAGNLVAKKPEIDFLLRVAGTTQISKAIQKVGSRINEPFLLVLASRRKAVGGGPKAGWKQLARRDLSERELERIEVAALLNAVRS